MRLPTRLRALRRFGDRRGAVAVIMALCAPVLMLMIGFAIDYGYALDMQQRIDAAADTAVLAALSPTTANESGGYGNAYMNGVMWYLASDTFTANTKSIPASIPISLTPPNISTGTSGNLTTYTATITWTASVPTWFAGLVGMAAIPIHGISSSTVTPPLYEDFYMMLDLSGSMDFGSTTTEQARLQAINTGSPDDNGYSAGCQFACHFAGYKGFSLSRNAGNAAQTAVTSCPQPGTNSCIQLRVDAVGSAIQLLLQQAVSTQAVNNQYRVGLYPFIRYLDSYYPLTYTLNGSPTNSSTINYAALNIAELSDNGGTGTPNSTLGSGGTHFENAFPSMLSVIQANGIGTGASAGNRLPWVFLVTDGMENTQTYTTSGGFQGGSNPSVFNSSLCTSLKSAGINIAVMLIQYPTLSPVDSAFSNDENGIANSQIPGLAAAAQACATSPTYFFAPTNYADIQTDMQEMFSLATHTPRLSQ